MATGFKFAGNMVLQGEGDPENGDALSTYISGYPIGTIYINNNTGKVFVRDAVAGVAADWVSQSSGSDPGYLVYTALLTQSGTDDPTATVLANTFSPTPVWTRVSVGRYKLTSAGSFTVGKTICTGFTDGLANIFTIIPVWDFSAIIGVIYFQPDVEFGTSNYMEMFCQDLTGVGVELSTWFGSGALSLPSIYVYP